MKQALAAAACSALALAPTPAAGGVGAERPRVQLSVSPARVALAAAGARRISVRNNGAERVVVDVTRQPPARKWLHIVPARLLLPSGATRTLTLRVIPPRPAEPGNRHAFVLLTTRPLRNDRVNVQARLGVRVTLRVPGPIVRHVTLGGLLVQRRRDARLMLVSVANRGNVTVRLGGRITAKLVGHGRQPARLHAVARRVLRPGHRAVVALRYTGRTRGLVLVIVQVRLGAGFPVAERRYRLRL